MKTIFVISAILLVLALSTSQAATVNNDQLAKYLCRSRKDGFKMLVPGSCSQYYQCKGDQALLKTCPNFYDSVKGECVTKNPGCVETIKVPLTCEGPCCGIKDGNYAVNAKNQAIYYLCKNNAVAEKKCCPAGEMFDLVLKKCSTPKVCHECTTTKPPCTTTTCTTKAPTTCTTTTCTTTPCTTTTCTTTPCTTTTCTTTTCTTTPCTTTSSSTTTCTTTTCTTTTCTTTTCTTTTCTITTGTTTPCTTTTCTTTTSTTTTSTKTTCTTTTCTTTTCTTTTCTTTTCTTTTCTTTTCTTTTCTTTTCTTTTCTTTPCTTTTCATTSKKTAAAHNSAESNKLQKNIDNYMSIACNDKPNGYLLASLTSCNEYYICRNRQALRVSCGKQYFNAFLGICDKPENTKCNQAQFSLP